MVFVIALAVVAMAIAFIVSYFMYVYFIHKKEKAFMLTAYSKWSIVISFTFILANPLMISLDRFKNHYMEEVPVSFKPYFDIFIFICLLLTINNMTVKSVYEAKTLRKLSKKFKFVCKEFWK